MSVVGATRKPRPSVEAPQATRATPKPVAARAVPAKAGRPPQRRRAVGVNLRAFGELGPMARIDAVRIGVPSTMLTELASAMAVSREVLLAWIGMARTTANNKLRTGASLSPEQGEKALGVAQLIALVDRVVRESGDAAGFDAARWTARWLQEPSPALGDRRPGDLMDTADGRAIVRRLVAQMQSGAYA